VIGDRRAARQQHWRVDWTVRCRGFPERPRFPAARSRSRPLLFPMAASSVPSGHIPRLRRPASEQPPAVTPSARQQPDCGRSLPARIQVASRVGGTDGSRVRARSIRGRTVPPAVRGKADPVFRAGLSHGAGNEGPAHEGPAAGSSLASCSCPGCRTSSGCGSQRRRRQATSRSGSCRARAVIRCGSMCFAIASITGTTTALPNWR